MTDAMALVGALLVLVGCVIFDSRWRPGGRAPSHPRIGTALILVGAILVLR